MEKKDKKSSPVEDEQNPNIYSVLENRRGFNTSSEEHIKIRDLRDNFLWLDNEYLDDYAKLCGINATGIYLSMCRHANKKQRCFPSQRLIAEELGISAKSVYNATKHLEKWGIIKVEGQGRKKDGSFRVKMYNLCHRNQWKEVPSATGAVGKRSRSPSATGTDDRRPLVPKNNTNINNTHINKLYSKQPEDRLQEKDKKSPLNEGSKEVNKVIGLFREVNPSFDRFYANKTERGACERLLKKWSFEEVKVLIGILPSLNAEKYAKGKSISPTELERNLGYIKAFIDQKKQGKNLAARI